MGKKPDELLAMMASGQNEDVEVVEVDCWHVNSKGIPAPKVRFSPEIEELSRFVPAVWNVLVGVIRKAAHDPKGRA